LKPQPTSFFGNNTTPVYQQMTSQTALSPSARLPGYQMAAGTQQNATPQPVMPARALERSGPDVYKAEQLGKINDRIQQMRANGGNVPQGLLNRQQRMMGLRTGGGYPAQGGAPVGGGKGVGGAAPGGKTVPGQPGQPLPTGPANSAGLGASLTGTTTPSGFDERFYLQTNPDVARAVAMGQFPSGLAHYQQFGQAEARTPLPSTAGGPFVPSPPAAFDPNFYLAQNPDVAAAVAAGQFTSPYQHYLLFGQQENRAALPSAQATTVAPTPYKLPTPTASPAAMPVAQQQQPAMNWLGNAFV
jgi:hypothetical protein